MNKTLLKKLSEHLKLEEEEVSSYTQGINNATNPVLGLLYKGFLEDSKRHIHIIRTIVSYYQNQGNNNTPFVSQIRDVEHFDLEDPVSDLIKEERKLVDDPFIDLLLESIEIDENKHAKIGIALHKLYSKNK